MKWNTLAPPWNPETVYDLVNLVALALIGFGVGMFSAGAALITVGVLVLALNIFAVLRESP